MYLTYKASIRGIRAFLQENPSILNEDPSYQDFFQPQRRFPLLPTCFDTSFVERLAHPESYQDISRKYNEYKEYQKVLRFIIENHKLYWELRCSRTKQTQLLEGYRRDLETIGDKLAKIQKQVGRYRITSNPEDLRIELFYPSIPLPSSKPILELGQQLSKPGGGHLHIVSCVS